MINVLIVEDEPLIAEAHRTCVTRLQGFSVAAVAHTARDAMRAAAEAADTEAPIDVVLLDIGLPDATGIALASGLSGLRPAPDIIAITSERDLQMVRAAVAHGAVTYLLKPFICRVSGPARAVSPLPHGAACGHGRGQPGGGGPGAGRAADQYRQVGDAEGRRARYDRRARARRTTPRQWVDR
jgi:CheY-like chemotaxis protein